MKLLIVTQVVDTRDAYLSFFHTWIEKLAHQVESIEVICLYEGEHALPANVRVHSLGKEKGQKSRRVYALRFLKMIWKLRGTYDRVFVHMNEEYVLLGGVLWKMMGKRIYLWRNHYAGSWKTNLAVALSRKVFYTSKHSYTARFRNAVQMPVGVDTERFEGMAGTRIKNSILFFGRFSPSKKPDVLVEALSLLKQEGIPFSASLYGTALPEDEAYRNSIGERIKDLGLSESVRMYPGTAHSEAHRIFSAHDIYVNLGASGMFDKTLFEAAASACRVVARSEDWRALTQDDRFWVEDDSAETVAKKLTALLQELERPEDNGQALAEVVRSNSLSTLIDALVREIR